MTGTSASRTMTSGSPVARASSVADTPPSTLFSMGTIAASAAPECTACSARSTLAQGSPSAAGQSGTCCSAASVNVPAGPR